MDGMGLRYVRRPDDEYDLWSVGPDGVDNGGKRDDTLGRVSRSNERHGKGVT